MRVGFIDSGVGGLIYAVEFYKYLTNNNFRNFEVIHIGDSKNMPYGLKSKEEIKNLAKKMIHKTIEFKIEKVVIACNTICSVLDQNFLKEFKEVRILNIIDYNLIEIDETIKQRECNFLILGTKRTIDSKIYENNILKNKNLNIDNIYSFNPLDWAEKIEKGIFNEEKKSLIFNYFDDLIVQIGYENFQKISILCLFCTHYLYFIDEIQEYFDLKNLKIQIIPNSLGIYNLLIKEADLKEENFIIKNNIKSYITGDNISVIEKTIKNIDENIKVDFLNLDLEI